MSALRVCTTRPPDAAADGGRRRSSKCFPWRGDLVYFAVRMRPMTTFLVLAALASCPTMRAAEPAATTQAPTKTYRNPLLPEREIADPFVLRVGGTYYLYPTTDARGYEVFVSGD